MIIMIIYFLVFNGKFGIDEIVHSQQDGDVTDNICLKTSSATLNTRFLPHTCPSTHEISILTSSA